MGEFAEVQITDLVERFAGVVEDLLPATSYRSVSASWSDVVGMVRTVTLSVSKSEDDQ